MNSPAGGASADDRRKVALSLLATVRQFCVPPPHGALACPASRLPPSCSSSSPLQRPDLLSERSRQPRRPRSAPRKISSSRGSRRSRRAWPTRCAATPRRGVQPSSAGIQHAWRCSSAPASGIRRRSTRCGCPAGPAASSPSSPSRSGPPTGIRRRGSSSSSPATPGGMSSARCTGSTSPPATSRSSPTVAARRTAAGCGTGPATGSPTRRRAATAPTATSGWSIPAIPPPTGSSSRMPAAGGASSIGRPTARSSWSANRSPSTRADAGSSTSPAGRRRGSTRTGPRTSPGAAAPSRQTAGRSGRRPTRIRSSPGS